MLFAVETGLAVCNVLTMLMTTVILTLTAITTDKVSTLEQKLKKI